LPPCGSARQLCRLPVTHTYLRYYIYHGYPVVTVTVARLDYPVYLPHRLPALPVWMRYLYNVVLTLTFTLPVAPPAHLPYPTFTLHTWFCHLPHPLRFLADFIRSVYAYVPGCLRCRHARVALHSRIHWLLVGLTTALPPQHAFTTPTHALPLPHLFRRSSCPVLVYYV